MNQEAYEALNRLTPAERTTVLNGLKILLTAINKDTQTDLERLGNLNN